MNDGKVTAALSGNDDNLWKQLCHYKSGVGRDKPVSLSFARLFVACVFLCATILVKGDSGVFITKIKDE
jgi:hypothetical protein